MGWRTPGGKADFGSFERSKKPRPVFRWARDVARCDGLYEMLPGRTFPFFAVPPFPFSNEVLEPIIFLAKNVLGTFE